MLTFDAETHTYRVAGRITPSVTQVLEPLQQLKGVPPALLERAREFGNHVHLATHLSDMGLLDEVALDAELVPYLVGWRKFRRDTGFHVVQSEAPMHSDLYGYAGTPDKIGTLGRDVCVLDIKSGVVPFTVGPQVAAYQKLIEPMPRKRLCVQLIPNDYRVHELKDPRDFAVFQSALNIHKFMKGKKVTYAD